MSHPDALPLLPIVEAVEKIFDLYNDYTHDPAKFSLTTKTNLLTVAVFKALLRHAIAPSSVARNFWQFLKPHFDDVLEEHGDPTGPQSLGPRHGGWTTIENKLLQMPERAHGDLTNEMNQHAYEWMARLLLPSTFLSLLPSTGTQVVIRSPLLREDPSFTQNRQHASQKGWKIP